MVLLWDRTYAKRLWCVFEMAAFTKTHKLDGRNSIQIRPVEFGAIFLMTFAYTTTFWCALLLVPRGGGKWGVFSVAAGMGCLCIHALRSYQRDLQSLRHDLRTFSAHSAECFCCAVDHVHPESGKAIFCDRQLVEPCIKAWFGSLEDFDNDVRLCLRDDFKRQLGRSGFPYFWVVVSGLPVLWSWMDFFAATCSTGAADQLVSIAIDTITMWLFVHPMHISTAMFVAGRMKQKREYMICDAFVDLWAVFLCTIFYMIIGGLWVILVVVLPSRILASVAYAFCICSLSAATYMIDVRMV